MSNFSFLEYSFDPNIINPEEIYTSLNRLGFVQRNIHISNRSSMWTQNQCIILLRESVLAPTPHVSGIGLIVDDQMLFPNDYFDEECGMYVMHDPNGFRILSMPEQNLAKMIGYGYEVVDRRVYDSPGLEFFSGIVYNSTNIDLVSFYETLGFRITRTSEKYDTLMSKNNRFTLLLNKTANTNLVDVIFTDTHDVFKTTSCYTVAGFDKKEYAVEQNSLDFGSKLNHKIIGYNCLAVGNKESYTIENSVKEPLPSFDLVFRTRKQYLHIEESVVEKHYASA